MRWTIAVLAALAGVACSTTVAQPQLWDVYTTSNQPFLNVTVDRYEEDTLHLKFMDRHVPLHHDSIAYVLQRKKPQFALGFLIGSVAGGIYAGSVLNRGTGPFAEIGQGFGTVYGVMIGGAVGGIFGAAAGSDKKYRIEKLGREEKHKVLGRLFPPPAPYRE